MITKLDDLVRTLAIERDLPYLKSADLVDAVLRHIAGDALRGESVRTPIGVFRRTYTKERNSRNPVTGEIQRIGETHRLAFRASSNFKGAGR